MDSRNNRYCIQ